MKVSTEYKNYLINKLNYKAKINLKSLNCDVCGKKKYSLISNKSLLSSKKNKYIKFPYVLCNNCGHAQQFFRFNKEVYTNYYSKILEANTERSNFRISSALLACRSRH